MHSLPDLPNEVVAVDNWDTSVPLDLKRYPDEIIVDARCGAAVLRGSHVYAPGIMGIPSGNFFSQSQPFLQLIVRIANCKFFPRFEYQQQSQRIRRCYRPMQERHDQTVRKCR